MLEIGTWSNAMAENIDMNGNSSEDEWNGMLPSNISICSRNKCKTPLIGYWSFVIDGLLFFISFSKFPVWFTNVVGCSEIKEYIETNRFGIGFIIFRPIG